MKLSPFFFAFFFIFP
ncbi:MULTISPECIES: pheA operon leader peptide PheL [Erwiniaceae]|nr:pheA operon leader peptide PheL [Duffyella gerundensis]